MRTFNVDSDIISHFVKTKNSCNILLIGKTGSGKSSLGNTLLGRNAMKTSENFFNSCTETVELHELSIEHVTVNIMDTPGLFDTKMKGNDVILLEITKAAMEFPEGVDVLLIVCRLDQPFTEEEAKTMKEIRSFFGDELYEHSVLVLTHGNVLREGTTLESMIRGSDTILALSEKVSQRCIAIENGDEVTLELHKEMMLSVIFQLIQQKNGKKYSHQIFEDVMKRQQEWKERGKKLEDIEKFIRDFVLNVLKISDAPHLQLISNSLQLDPQNEEKLKNCKQISDNTRLLFENNVTVEKIVKRYLDNSRELLKLMMLKQKDKVNRIVAENQVALQKAEKAIHDELNKTIDAFTEKELHELIQDKCLPSSRLTALHNLVNIDVEKVESFVQTFCNNYRDLLQSTLDVMVEERKQKKKEEERMLVKGQVNEIVQKNARAFIRKFGKKEMIKMKNQIKTGRVPPELQSEIKSKLPSDIEMTDEELHDIIKTVLQDNHQLIDDILKKHCFPASAKVIVKRAGSILISQLRVGDKVLTLQSNNLLQYEDVFFVAHSDSDSTTTYIKVQTESGAEISISPSHCIPIASTDNPRPASEIAVGNIIFSVRGKIVVPDKVSSITTVRLRGAYCPYTLNGTIVVNNVVSSCYSNTVNPVLSQSLLYPLRMMYKSLPVSIYTMLFNKETMATISESARKWVQNFTHKINI